MDHCKINVNSSGPGKNELDELWNVFDLNSLVKKATYSLVPNRRGGQNKLGDRRFLLFSNIKKRTLQKSNVILN